MELRRREPDLRFNVVHTSRSVKRKKERSFLPPTAFCRTMGDTKGLMSPCRWCCECSLPQFPPCIAFAQGGTGPGPTSAWGLAVSSQG